jgi:lipoprotein NlpI
MSVGRGLALVVLLGLAAGVNAASEDFRRCGALASKIPDSAIEHCDKALTRDGLSVRDAAAAHLARAIAWRTKGDARYAIADLDQAIALDPGNSNAHVMRGVAWRSRGDDDKALADFDEAIRLSPDAAAYGARGDIWRQRREFARACSDYSQAIALDPDNPFGYRVRASTWLEEGDYEKAAQDYQEALRRDPKSSIASHSLGVARFLQGRYEQSADALSASLQPDAPDLHSLLWRYLAQARAGHVATARAALAEGAARVKAKQWPVPLLDYFMDRIDAAALRQLAEQGDAPGRVPRRCEVDFYLGERLLVEGRRTDARPLLRAATEHCGRGTYQAIAAGAELKR